VALLALDASRATLLAYAVGRAVIANDGRKRHFCPDL
jgi:hypothetical protein